MNHLLREIRELRGETTMNQNDYIEHKRHQERLRDAKLRRFMLDCADAAVALETDGKGSSIEVAKFVPAMQLFSYADGFDECVFESDQHCLNLLRELVASALLEERLANLPRGRKLSLDDASYRMTRTGRDLLAKRVNFDVKVYDESIEWEAKFKDITE